MKSATLVSPSQLTRLRLTRQPPRTGARLDMSTVVSHVENGIPMDEPENAKAVAEDLDRQRTSLAERLRLAHADAVSKSKITEGSQGKFSTGINGEVGVSGFNAGVRRRRRRAGGGGGGGRRGPGL